MIKAPDCVKPVPGTITFPVPLVVKFNVPVTAVLALRVRSALVVLKFALAPAVIAPSVRALASFKVKPPAPVSAKFKLLKSVVQVRAAAALRKVISALVALKLILASPSDKSLALMVNPAG